MRKLTMVLAALLTVMLFATGATTPGAGAQGTTTDTVPYWMEPAPVCGSDLHLSEGLDCVADDTAGLLAIGTRVCPNLSQGRFNGYSYDYSVDPLGVVTYNNPNIATRQATDNARTWVRYCAIPLATPQPTPTPTPTEIVGPVPSVPQCPAGHVWVGTSPTGAVLCAVEAGPDPTPTPIPTVAPIVPLNPVSVPTIKFTG